MNEFLEKVQRIKPIVRVRSIQYDKEFFLLTEIRAEKQKLIEELTQYQEKYIQAVTELNTERESGRREKLDILEIGIEAIKSKWIEILKNIRMMEAREEAQEKAVEVAKRNLKSVEKLLEIYNEELLEFEKHEDLKVMDDIAVRMFNNN